ncbi:MAG: glycosyltransferase, partial [Bacteroidota bacterium]|nr:glycosyltransferase [Bacteroidota bacterium]
ILPVRNGGAYVKECVNSILLQTHPDFNLVVLDNASSDGTLEWVHSLKEKRIIIHESDKSLSIEENWSRIKSVPKNEYITLIGHDDLLNADYLEVMDKLIGKHPEASLYQSHFNYINDTGSVLNICKPMDEIQYADEFLACFMCDTINSTGTGYMMRSKDYDAVGGMDCSFDNLIFADYALWIDLMLKGYKATSPEITFQYRIHNSLSKTTGGQQYQQAFENFLQFVIDRAKANDKIKMITERYGKTMLLYYCESLSHRLLKTPRNQREIIVSEFIEKCNKYAALIIPGQDFNPLKKIKINVARILDNTAAGRNIFLLFKKIFP